MTDYETYPQTSNPTPPTPPAPKRLTRSSREKVLGGVCGGFAEYSGIDANLIRIALVAATVFGLGSGIILYAVAWWLLPQQ